MSDFSAYQTVLPSVLQLATTPLVLYHQQLTVFGASNIELNMWNVHWQKGYNWMWHGMMWEHPDEYDTRLSDERRLTSDGALFRSPAFRSRFANVVGRSLHTLAVGLGFRHNCGLTGTSDHLLSLVNLVFGLAADIGTTNNTERHLIQQEIPTAYNSVMTLLSHDPVRYEIMSYLAQMRAGNLPSALADEPVAKLLTENINISFGWD